MANLKTLSAGLKAAPVVLLLLLALSAGVAAKPYEGVGAEVHPMLLSFTTAGQDTPQTRVQSAQPNFMMRQDVSPRMLRALARNVSTKGKASRSAASGASVSEVRVMGSLPLNADEKAVRDVLRSLGVSDVTILDGAVYCWMPTGSIALLSEKTAGYVDAWRPDPAMTQAGSVTSQGDDAMRTDLVRALLGLSGSGIKVGILSDSFNKTGGATADVLSGDLPGTVFVLKEGPSGIDEGRAIAQIVHDVAPEADIYFYTAYVSQVDFAAGIVALQQAGCQVIVDDIMYLAEPMFSDGRIAQAVDLVQSRGVAYFSSAGNRGHVAYRAAFNSAGYTLPALGIPHDFDTSPGTTQIQQSWTVPAGGADCVFQWSNLFYTDGPTAGTLPGATADLDMYFFIGASYYGSVSSSNLESQGGDGDPLEMFSIGQGTFNVRILLYSGPAPSMMSLVCFDPVTFNTFATDSATTYGHANAAGAVAVGAAWALETPWNGYNPPILETYSSRGGMPIFFDNTGAAIPGGVVRQKPDIVGPDGVDTTFFGFSGINDGTPTFPNFFGTSASVAHVGALAALMLEYRAIVTPDQIVDILKTTAIDMGTPGFDFDSGPGFVNGTAALEELADRIECAQDSDCTSNLNGDICYLGPNVCVECLQNSDCASNANGDTCYLDLNVCVECIADANCTSNASRPLCYGKENLCVECLSDTDCASSPNGPTCDLGVNLCFMRCDYPDVTVSLNAHNAALTNLRAEGRYTVSIDSCRSTVDANELGYLLLDQANVSSRAAELSMVRVSGRRHLAQMDSTANYLIFLAIYMDTQPQAASVTDILNSPAFIAFLLEALHLLTGGNMNLISSEVLLAVLASARSDPHFSTLSGDKFDFNGVAGQSYCIVTDKQLQVNARFVGAAEGNALPASSSQPDTRTWMDQVAVMHGRDRILIDAASPPGAPFALATGTLLVNGEPMLPRTALKRLPSGMTVLRKKNYVTLTIPGVAVVEVEVVRAAFWEAGLGPGKNFINLQVKHFNGTQAAHGVLGQSFALPGSVPADRDAADYATSDILAANCQFNQFLDGPQDV